MSLGKSQRQMADAALFRAIVDQFVARKMHPTTDLDQFEKLATGFIDLLDADGAGACALDLCLYSETPPSVIARLLDKGGKAARIAFEFARAIHPEVLRATAEHGPEEFAAAIARRSTLDRRIASILASRGESEVLCALAANGRVHLDQAARRALTLAGRDDLRLARILLDRGDLSLDAEPLFLAATKAERAAIVLEACARVLTSSAPENLSRPSPQVAAEIEACAIARDKERLADALTEALDCRKSRVRAILADAGGEALALALVVLAVSEDTALRIFLALEQKAEPDVERLRSLIALMRSTPPRAAQRLAAAITGAARQEKDVSRRATNSEGAPTQASRKQAAEPARAARRFARREAGSKLS